MKIPDQNNRGSATNVLRDQLKAQRSEMIAQVTALRQQRTALKGVKGTGEQWDVLCVQIDTIQDKIDLISRSLGLPVKERHGSFTSVPNRSNRLFRANRSGRGHDQRTPAAPAPSHPPVSTGDDESLMILDDEDLAAWDRFNESVDNEK